MWEMVLIGFGALGTGLMIGLVVGYARGWHERDREAIRKVED
jgi:F0F1-type ATP synthase membrane subunit c/vacuolar-type H+-ATPase subunit K